MAKPVKIGNEWFFEGTSISESEANKRLGVTPKPKPKAQVKPKPKPKRRGLADRLDEIMASEKKRRSRFSGGSLAGALSD